MSKRNTETAMPSRYARQTALPLIGPEGQAVLRAAAVLIVGSGALGCAQAELLVRSGVGRLILVDRDVVELHNLHRQLLFDEEDVRARLPKAEAAARRLRQINADVTVEARVLDVTAENVAALVGAADIVLDGTDNFETRYLLNDAAVAARKPWVYGGVAGTDGLVMAVAPHEGPCLRCLFEEPPDTAASPTCETLGVLNTVVVWTAALQVTQAWQILMGRSLTPPQLHVLDIWRGTVNTVAVARRADCPCCGARQFEFLSGERSSWATTLCSRNAVQVSPERPTSLDLLGLQRRLSTHGTALQNGLVLEFSVEDYRLTVFPDGRVLVMGTMDKAVARGLVARYIGC